jgi:hypothetical protein
MAYNKCHLHPTYDGENEPQNTCEKCWAVYHKLHSDKKKKPIQMINREARKSKAFQKQKQDRKTKKHRNSLYEQE